MATFKMVPVSALVEPLHPQREETLMLNMDEFRAGIRDLGLQQPIGVVDLGTGEYRIVWGHRRSIAVTQLGWELIPAMVHALGEIDEDIQMGTENFQRQAVSLREEAIYYKRVVTKYAEGTIGLARELNVSQKRIEELLRCADGDEATFAAMGEGKVSLAQAVQINMFKSPGYRLQALDRAINEGTSGDYLRRWRKEIQRQGMDDAALQVQTHWNDTVPTTPTMPTDLCNIGNHDVPLMERKIYSICHDHYNIFLKGLEALGKLTIIEEQGYLPEFVKLLRKAEGG